MVLAAAAGALDPAALVSCEVCMCDYTGAECGRNGCGHTFCSGCWRSHLAVQIQEGKARHISCMAFKCGVVCDEDLVMQTIKVGAYACWVPLFALVDLSTSFRDARVYHCHPGSTDDTRLTNTLPMLPLPAPLRIWCWC
jgi:hypothetical protein